MEAELLRRLTELGRLLTLGTVTPQVSMLVGLAAVAYGTKSFVDAFRLRPGKVP